ncbi:MULTISPECIES: hypothetical protein [unclassified Janthinobacterium]|nr:MULTISPECIES: hypothetical protein [unclassified Janthinobacterium]
MLVDLFCGDAAGPVARQPPLSTVRGAHGITLLNPSEKLTAVDFKDQHT